MDTKRPFNTAHTGPFNTKGVITMSKKTPTLWYTAARVACGGLAAVGIVAMTAGVIMAFPETVSSFIPVNVKQAVAAIAKKPPSPSP